MIEIETVPRPDWEPLPVSGCHGVEGKVLLAGDRLAIAMLRFSADATLDEHAADFDVDVICLDGAGFVSVDGASSELNAGQRVRWPASKPHRLWTRETGMVTLMVEHHGGKVRDSGG